MNRGILVFLSVLSVCIIASISSASPEEQPRLDSEYINWCIEQLSPEMRLEIGACSIS
jgi:hypothetical protein